MEKAKNGFIKNLHYLCLIGVITIGLITIVGTGGGGTNGGNGTPTVSTISISPDSASITVGDTQQFNATAKDSSGNVLENVTFSWSSSGYSRNDHSGRRRVPDVVQHYFQLHWARDLPGRYRMD